jgi:hypothetical protein
MTVCINYQASLAARVRIVIEGAVTKGNLCSIPVCSNDHIAIPRRLAAIQVRPHLHDADRRPAGLPGSCVARRGNPVL